MKYDQNSNNPKGYVFYALLFFMGLMINLSSAQGASVSWKKKIKEPIETLDGHVIDIGDEIQINEGVNQDGSFRYVQFVNNFNEPIQNADSRAAFKKQKVKFFKEQDGVHYLFTKYFCININAAFKNGEISLK
ncbi:hypothetical protein [Maribacter sp. Hel_I_7]|uniref:hypothetical protein n=1 Tax=Maribacter sp. Hel_I_7 TaxID=1249997 RepID=UPI00047C0A6C|nr:hypothetical protein [Maribacter sp. Hel_I_7]